jgi:hypothetical protein
LLNDWEGDQTLPRVKTHYFTHAVQFDELIHVLGNFVTGGGVFMLPHTRPTATSSQSIPLLHICCSY